MNFYYFDQTGHKQGPINEQQLKALALQGAINPQTPLETDTGHRGLAGQIPGVFAAPASASPCASASQSVPAPVASNSKGLPKSVVFGGIAVLLSILLVAGIWWMSSSTLLTAVDSPQHSTTEEQKQVDDLSAKNDAAIENDKNDGAPFDTEKQNNSTATVESLASPTEATPAPPRSDEESIDTEQSQIKLFCDMFGSDIKSTDVTGMTLLHQASAIGNLTAIKFLVSQGADVNVRKKDGTTPLHMAGGNMAAKVIKTLHEDNPLIHMVDVNSSAEIVKFLISEGAEVNAKTESGQTPLHLATTHNENIDVIKHLVSSGAEVDAKDNEGRTPLSEAIRPKVNAEIAEYLISQGADVNVKFRNMLKDRQTPLHRAVVVGNVEIVKSLISHGAKLNVKDKQGNTPIHIAIQIKNLELVKLLVSQGADLTVKNYSDATPLV